jgi:phenylacetate-CoA ligase
LNWLLARKPAYLGVYPPVLKDLARAALRRGVELKLDLIMAYAAVVDDETRELARAVFGCEIADTYGAEEVGHIAAQCRQCGEYHISAESVLLEVLRDDGTPAVAGEVGRVVVTPLYNFAMPLVRYELGDLAVVGSKPAKCGRGLPTLRRILGRTRNMFRLRDGRTIWPIVWLFELNRFIDAKQFQIVQTDFDDIEIRYLPNDRSRPVDLAGLTDKIGAVLRHPVQVSLHPVDKIARSQSGKFEDFISLVAPT